MEPSVRPPFSHSGHCGPEDDGGEIVVTEFWTEHCGSVLSLGTERADRCGVLCCVNIWIFDGHFDVGL